MTSFPNALCYGSDLPAAGRPCRVEVSSEGFSLRFPDVSPATIEIIPFDAVTIDAGGCEHDRLVVAWVRDGADRKLYVSDRDVVEAAGRYAPPELRAHVRRSMKRMIRAQRGRRTLLIAFAAAIVAAVWVLWFGLGLLVSVAVSRMPIEWERAIGETVREEFLAGRKILTDGAAVEAVQHIAQRLIEQIPNSPYTFTVTVVQSDTVNALALPGGFVIVSTGLLKNAESPEEVAGVLAHEINHVLLRHGLEGFVKNLGLTAVVAILAGNQQGLVGLAERFGLQLAGLKFSRENETQADLEGLHLLHRARIAPDGMIRFFERLAQFDKVQLELLSTHPMSAARAARLLAEAASLTPQQSTPFPFDWSTVRAHLRQPGHRPSVLSSTISH